MTRKEFMKQKRRKKLKRRIRKIIYNVLLWVSEHPVRAALPIIIVMAALAIHAAVFINSLEAREAEQPPVTMGQKETEQKPLTMMDVYGCESLIGVYEYPYNTMSQDWGVG